MVVNGSNRMRLNNLVKHILIRRNMQRFNVHPDKIYQMKEMRKMFSLRDIDVLGISPYPVSSIYDLLTVDSRHLFLGTIVRNVLQAIPTQEHRAVTDGIMSLSHDEILSNFELRGIYMKNATALDRGCLKERHVGMKSDFWQKIVVMNEVLLNYFES